MQNSTPVKNVINDTKGLCRPIIDFNDRGNEPSKNETLDFEAIDERDLPMLTKNYDDLVGSQMTTESKLEAPNITSTRLEDNITSPTTLVRKSSSRIEDNESINSVLGERSEVDEFISGSGVTSTIQVEPTVEYHNSNPTVRIIENQSAPLLLTASIELDANQDIEMNSELSTHDEPSGLSFGERTPTVETTTVSSPRQISNHNQVQSKQSENILTDALSRLNLPNDDEEDLTYVEKIINAVGLEFDPEIEILEFSEMIGAIGTVGEEKEPEPVELNSFEFFVQALSHFEGEARGQLSSGEQSPATPVESLSPRVEINAIKTAILQESHSNWSKLLDESPSTLNGPSGLLIGERSDDDSLTSMMVNAIDLDNNIIGTNSSLTSETSNG